MFEFILMDAEPIEVEESPEPEPCAKCVAIQASLRNNFQAYIAATIAGHVLVGPVQHALTVNNHTLCGA